MLHQYGRSLLENAVAMSGALGGGMPEATNITGQEPIAPSKSDARFAFGGDGPDEINDAREFSQATQDKNSVKRKADEEGDRENDVLPEGAEDEDRPEGSEDDMGLAFEILDLARLIYERILNGSTTQETTTKGKEAAKIELSLITGEMWNETTLRAELADVRNDLGDIGLETGKI